MDGKWMAKMASVTPGIVGKFFTKKKKKKKKKKPHSALGFQI